MRPTVIPQSRWIKESECRLSTVEGGTHTLYRLSGVDDRTSSPAWCSLSAIFLRLCQSICERLGFVFIIVVSAVIRHKCLHFHLSTWLSVCVFVVCVNAYSSLDISLAVGHARSV